MPDEMLINFFRGTGPDGLRWYHADILVFTDDDLGDRVVELEERLQIIETKKL